MLTGVAKAHAKYRQTVRMVEGWVYTPSKIFLLPFAAAAYARTDIQNVSVQSFFPLLAIRRVFTNIDLLTLTKFADC